jgi:arabinose-5-phosphate isomerase
LALALLEKRGWRAEDFVFVHPGGTLGARSLRRVGELMHTGAALPRVPVEASFATVLAEVSAKGLGVTAVVDEAGRLQGVITDGDVRRHLLRSAQATQAVARDLMTTQPKLIGRDELAAKAVQVMEHHKITSLFIVDNAARPEGVVHLHDLMQAFIV